MKRKKHVNHLSHTGIQGIYCGDEKMERSELRGPAKVKYTQKCNLPSHWPKAARLNGFSLASVLIGGLLSFAMTLCSRHLENRLPIPQFSEEGSYTFESWRCRSLLFHLPLNLPQLVCGLSFPLLTLSFSPPALALNPSVTPMSLKTGTSLTSKGSGIAKRQEEKGTLSTIL